MAHLNDCDMFADDEETSEIEDVGINAVKQIIELIKMMEKDTSSNTKNILVGIVKDKLEKNRLLINSHKEIRDLLKISMLDAIICLGTVIRGSTPHFEYIASEVAKGIAKVSVDTGVPVIFGIITADTIEQAIERAGTKECNKGKDAALNAIEMANLVDKLGK